METETPKHKVSFEYSFYVAKYEVPQNLWEAVMGSNPSRWKGPRNSVEELTFNDAQKFCVMATRLMRSAKLISKDQEIRCDFKEIPIVVSSARLVKDEEIRGVLFEIDDFLNTVYEYFNLRRVQLLCR